MRILLRSPLLVLTGALIDVSSSSAATAAFEARIASRTYDGDRILSPSDRAGAQATATGILQTAGLDVEWKDCELQAPETMGRPA